MSSIGYSGTPLPRKLGIREGDRVRIAGAAPHLAELLGELPGGATCEAGIGAADVLLFATTERARLADAIAALGEAIYPDGACWIAWPKRASEVPTDMTEDAVRDAALPLGLVDNKVCAIDGIWSGLRLVWRRELRTTTSTGSR